MTGIIGWFTNNGFLLEFLTCVILTVYWMPKRDRFAARAVIAALCVLILGALWGLFATDLESFSVTVRIFMIIKYIVFCIAYAFILMIPFDLTVTDAMFYMSAAGSAQHLIYKLSDVLTFVVIPHQPTELEKSAVYVSLFVVFALVYFLTGARMFAKYKCMQLNKPQAIALVAGFLLVSGVYENLYKLFQPGIRPELYFFMAIYDIITILFVLILDVSLVVSQKSERDISFMHSMLREQRIQLETSKENVEFINIKMHDIKHMVSSLDNQITKEQMAELSEAVNAYEAIARTGNETLDIVLTEKSILCEKNGIRLSYMANGEIVSFMKDSDLYSLVVNALNNAIEAVLKIPDPESRIIDMRIQAQNGCALFRFENTAAVSPVVRDGIIETSKADKTQHGYGIKSMEHIVKQYRGSFFWNYDAGRFIVTAMLPVPAGNGSDT